MTEQPKPGSPEAVAEGCTCPTSDNHHGKGHLGKGQKFGWWINGGCPLHNRKEANHGE